MNRWTKRWLKNHEIPRLERVLKAGKLASAEELKALADEYKGGSRADYCEWCRKLSTFARRQEWLARKEGRTADADSYETALAALEDRAEVVELPSVKLTVMVTPASWARIMVIEDLDFWLLKLGATRIVLQSRDVDALADKLESVQEEMSHCRSRLYAEITAPEPAPLNETVDWADKITPVEEGAIMEAWHRVNTDVLRRLPQPKSKKDGHKLPTSWSLVFQSVSWREKRPSKEVIRDRSLVSLCAETVLEAIKSEQGKSSESLADVIE